MPVSKKRKPKKVVKNEITGEALLKKLEDATPEKVLKTIARLFAKTEKGHEETIAEILRRRPDAGEIATTEIDSHSWGMGGGIPVGNDEEIDDFDLITASLATLTPDLAASLAEIVPDEMGKPLLLDDPIEPVWFTRPEFFIWHSTRFLQGAGLFQRNDPETQRCKSSIYDICETLFSNPEWCRPVVLPGDALFPESKGDPLEAARMSGNKGLEMMIKETLAKAQAADIGSVTRVPEEPEGGKKRGGL